MPPFNGSGGVTQPSGSIYPATANTLIESAKANTSIADIYTMLASCVVKDGQQTITANIPMAGFKLTGLGAGATNGDAIRWQQSAAGVMTTTGDMLLASAANTPARLPAAATVAAHATTMDPWVARIVTLSGGAVTFTDIADADFIGQEVLLVMNAAHVWTNGAVFDVQGGADYTAEAGDLILLTSTAVDAFDVTIFKADGRAVIAPANASDTVAGVIEIAIQSEMETASSTTLAVTPGRQQFHASAAKAWGKITAATTVDASYPASGVSINNSGTGVYVVTHGLTFSSANYAVNVTVSGSSPRFVSVTSRTTTTFTVTFYDNATVAAAVIGFDYACLGDL